MDTNEQRGIHDQVAALRAYADELAASQIESSPEWRPALDRIDALADQPPEVAVALLGGTGAGKSTLVNALARKRILPVSSMKACTSAITEVAYGENGFAVDVEFVDRDSWRKELFQLEQDIADFREAAGEASVELGIRKEAEDKIRTVYGESAVAYFVSLDQDELVEPHEVGAAFAAGSVQFRTDDDSVFRDQLKRYLDSDHPFWPIVKRVRVRGPFDDLDDGVVLVDLPGLNDPNAAREEAARQHLRGAQFVWVVFNMKRALTRDIFDYLRESDLLRQLFMDGRTGSLTFVGTASDDIDEDNDIERLGLGDDATTVKIVRARSAAVKLEVRSQLEELATLVTRDALEPGENGSELVDHLRAAPIHCVSAKEFQKIIGVMRRSNQLLRDPDETGIPGLHGHLAHLVAHLGVEAHRSRLNQDLAAVRLEMQRAVASRRATMHAQRQATEAQLEEVRAAAAQSRRFLVDRTNRAVETMDAQLATGTELLSARLEHATANAERELDGLAVMWRGMHWATLRATVRRGGRWVSRDRSIDLPAQIAKPILDGVSFAWVDFFGHRAVVAVETLDQALAHATADFVDHFELACGSVPALAALLQENGSNSTATAKRLVAHRTAQLRRDVQARLDQDRRNLADQITEHVAKAMRPAFDSAYAQRGQGVRDRMIAIVHDAARSAASQVSTEVNASVSRLLRELVAYVDEQVDELVVAVHREADALAAVVTDTAESAMVSGDTDVDEELEALEQRVPGLVPA